ncbi:L-type lectin-domain containing receptor kinase IX.1 [Forsythia ovata]|uniref:L-type lectin-domain containing receptor kinase IX.1 n=1 Tax=Forsythia ovata TaxID=205694 RepID=A0ABD1QLP8_9LAMI
MAHFNSWNTVSVFFSLLFPFASSLSFNLSSIGPNDANSHINTTGDAYISPQGLQVTTDESYKASGGKTGRATYIKPLHLWDKASGNLTDFYTHFSFVIDSIDSSDSNCHADGLAFFLAPFGSSIPVNSFGSGLGLAYFNATANISGDPFVAVEFDTYRNSGDPYNPHVGIDINSLISATTITWSNNITQGEKNDAWISYNSTTKILGVIFTGYMGDQTQSGRLNYSVDLRNYLPEWVSFGFSAATGSCSQKNNVKSWEFDSTLEIVTNNPGLNYTDPSIVPNINSDSRYADRGRKKMKMGLVIGLTVGLSVLILGLVFVAHTLWRKRNKEGTEDDISFDISMDTEFEKGCGPKKFSYGELVCATDNFADEKMLGEGGFGGVYQGFLRDSNSYIAVKRVSKGSKQGTREYASEVKIISRLRHRNLVQLVVKWQLRFPSVQGKIAVDLGDKVQNCPRCGFSFAVSTRRVGTMCGAQGHKIE